MDFSEKYRLEKRLGTQRKRKFGELFLATNKSTNQTVILKAVRLHQNETTAVDRLREEARFSFDFPGLPKTIEFQETQTNAFLIRAFVEGVTLDEHWTSLKRKRRLPFLLEFLQKLVPIFEHLQEHGIVHCDIKPSNFLIEQTSDSFEVHLLDFGLALRLSEKEVNRQRKLLFPLGYAAPELLLNHLDIVDQRTDIFALGIVIWRLFSGHLPLVHPNPSVFTNLQITHPLPEHSEVSRKLYAVLEKMTKKHQFSVPPNRMDQQEVKDLLITARNNRYASVEEVIDSLQKVKNRRFW